MENECADMIKHINRLQGQLESVKKELARGDAVRCGSAARTLLSALRSFEGLRTSFITSFLQGEFLDRKALGQNARSELHDLLALIKG